MEGISFEPRPVRIPANSVQVLWRCRHDGQTHDCTAKTWRLHSYVLKTDAKSTCNIWNTHQSFFDYKPEHTRFNGNHHGHHHHHAE